MVEVEFDCFGAKTVIQCKEKDKLFVIIQQFLLKSQKDKEKICFLYNGQILDSNLTFNETANDLDKKRKKMSVIVSDKDAENEEENQSSKIKAKYIICPKCNDCTNFSINDFLITLDNCKNGHKSEDMKIEDFEKTQYIDESKIKCDNCQKTNKSITYENQFFICFKCNKNLCPLCKASHDKTHHIINYEDKDFMCNKHRDIFVSYCIDCKKDICTLCTKEHNSHKIIVYGNILPDTSNFEKDLEKTKEIIDNYKDKIEIMIKRLNILKKDLDNYYNLFANYTEKFDIRKRNYSILQNINNIINYNNIFIKDTNKEIKTKLEEIIDLSLFKVYHPVKFYDNDNIIANIVKENVIVQFKDKLIVFMTTELPEENYKPKYDMFIKNIKQLYSNIYKYLDIFKKKTKENYIDNFIEFLNKNGDKATSEYDEDEGLKYYCLISKKTIKEINELNEKYLFK